MTKSQIWDTSLEQISCLLPFTGQTSLKVLDLLGFTPSFGLKPAVQLCLALSHLCNFGFQIFDPFQLVVSKFLAETVSKREIEH